MAASVSGKFKDRFEVVRKLKEAVESSWPMSPTTNPTECCHISSWSSGQEYDSRFGKTVDFSRVCVKIPDGAQSSRKHVADSVVAKMKDMMKNHPFLKWQYFASEDGTYTNFPAFDDFKADCRSYDPRFRPFYVETATPDPKDVVLVFDRSESMHFGDRIKVAKEAAKTFLSTLNPNDRVSIE